MKRTFDICLQCYNFPTNNFENRLDIYVGVQEKKAVVMDTSITTDTKDFTLPVFVKPAKNGPPNFLGDFVHGKVGDRFLYLVWYNKIGDEKMRFRRVKIKLAPIAWEHIERSIQEKTPIRAKINLTDSKGGPVCATLKSTNIKWEFEAEN